VSSYIQDLEEVRELIQLYIDGSNGDVAKLKRAFHQDAWMYGRFGKDYTIFPIAQFFAMVEANPGMAGPNYKAIVQSIDITGMPVSRCWPRRTISVATSSTTSWSRGSTGAGRLPTRPMRTPGAPRPDNSQSTSKLAKAGVRKCMGTPPRLVDACREAIARQEMQRRWSERIPARLSWRSGLSGNESEPWASDRSLAPGVS
jgi:Putative lumazine-binding